MCAGVHGFIVDRPCATAEGAAHACKGNSALETFLELATAKLLECVCWEAEVLQQIPQIAMHILSL